MWSARRSILRKRVGASFCRSHAHKHCATARKADVSCTIEATTPGAEPSAVENTRTNTLQHAAQTEQSDVSVLADVVICESHSPPSFADVEANEEFKTNDQEKSTFERQPSVSRTDTSCAGARIVAESDQSRSRHNSMKPLQTNTLR